MPRVPQPEGLEKELSRAHNLSYCMEGCRQRGRSGDVFCLVMVMMEGKRLWWADCRRWSTGHPATRAVKRHRTVQLSCFTLKQ